MKAQLIAYTTAAAIALTSLTAAPAQAGPNDDLVKFLVGAVILGAVVNEVNKNNKRAVTRSTEEPRRYYKKPHRHTPRHTAAASRVKPEVCKRSAYRDHRLKVWYRRACMERNGWERHGSRGWHTHW